MTIFENCEFDRGLVVVDVSVTSKDGLFFFFFSDSVDNGKDKINYFNFLVWTDFLKDESSFLKRKKIQKFFFGEEILFTIELNTSGKEKI